MPVIVVSVLVMSVVIMSMREPSKPIGVKRAGRPLAISTSVGSPEPLRQAWRKGSGDPTLVEIAKGLPARFTPIGFEGSRMLMMTTLMTSTDTTITGITVERRTRARGW